MMNKRLFSALAIALGVASGALATQAQAAEEAPDANPLVQKCLAQGQAKDGKTFNTHLVASNNLKRYVPNQPYRLTVSLNGHGDAFYNLSCNVDASGNVSYQGYFESGMPLE